MSYQTASSPKYRLYISANYWQLSNKLFTQNPTWFLELSGTKINIGSYGDCFLYKIYTEFVQELFDY